MNILLAIPPLSNLSSPYPSTAHLYPFLTGLGHDTVQVDVSIEVALRLFSARGLEIIHEHISKHHNESISPGVKSFVAQFEAYVATWTSLSDFYSVGIKRTRCLFPRAVFCPRDPVSRRSTTPFDEPKSCLLIVPSH